MEPQKEGLLLQSKHKFYLNITPAGETSNYKRLAKGFSGFEPSRNEETDQTAYLDGEGDLTTTVTGGQTTLSFSGHRFYGDPVQDFIFSKQNKNGLERETTFRWELPSGEKIEGPVTIAEITGPSGDANNKGSITVAIHFNGTVEYTPAPTS